jgi:hypothetical protein
MSNAKSFAGSEWIIPPIVVPVFLGLLIAASVIF